MERPAWTGGSFPAVSAFRLAARAPDCGAGLRLLPELEQPLWLSLIVFDEGMKSVSVGFARFTPVGGTHKQLVEYSIAMAGIAILFVPSPELSFVLQKHFIQGISHGCVKQ